MKKLLLFTLFFLSITLHAEPLPADQAFTLSATAKDYQTILVQWKIAPNYYLYEKHFSFTVLQPKNVVLGNPLYPSGAQLLHTPLGTFSVYANSLILPIPILQATEKSVILQAHYQGCSKLGFCYPPTTKTVSINLSGNYMQWVPGLNIDLSPTPHSLTKSQTRAFFPLILSFLGFGILLSLTPCVLPMIPILSSIILGRKHFSTLHAFCLSLFYVLGMALTYALIGVLFSLLGKNVQIIFQQPWVMIIFAILFIVMALSLFGLFQLQLPAKLRSVLAKKSFHQKRGTYFGALMMGVLSTLILSPCVTPPLVAALGIISEAGNMALGGFALFAMGCGMGAPLLLIGALGPKILPKPGRWMNVIKYGMGIIMIGMAVMMVQRAKPQWFHPVFQTTTASQSSLPFHSVKSVAEINSALISADKENKIVMLDFSATWCLACKEFNSFTLQNEQVQMALSKMVLLRADVTQNTMEDQLLEQHYGVIAPPTLLFFQHQKEIPRSRIIGYKPAKPFLKHLETLTRAS